MKFFKNATDPNYWGLKMRGPIYIYMLIFCIYLANSVAWADVGSEFQLELSTMDASCRHEVSVRPGCKISLAGLVDKLASGTAPKFVHPAEGYTSDHSYRSICDRPALGLAPVVKTEVDGRTFYLSKKVINPEPIRSYLVGYSKNEQGCMIPILFYRSMSSGEWRTTPGTEDGGRLLKGAEGHPEQHYVQETKLHPKLLDRISEMEEVTTNLDIGLYFKDSERSRLGIGTSYYESNIDYTLTQKFNQTLALLKIWKPGNAPKGMESFFCSTSTDEFLKQINGEMDKLKKSGFMPDFSSAPQETYKINHTLFSKEDPSRPHHEVKDITVEVYRTKFRQGKLEREIEWHMAHTSDKKQVWIDRIMFKPCKVTIYGNCSEVLNSGYLTNKPVEYVRQCSWIDGTKKGELFKPAWQWWDASKGCQTLPTGIEGTYQSLAPVLQEIYPIKQWLLRLKSTDSSAAGPAE